MSSVAAPARLNGYRSPAARYKDLLLGPPLATSRLVQERLRKVVALAVFSSDAISSTAYGTEQIMLILVAAGALATRLAFPIALAIGALLAILILSYRQTITAYPSAGGAYVVSRDNFGPRWALVAGSALLIDYVLTVAVSVSSGVAALTTALPSLQRLVLPLSLAAIGLIMWANLRGVRESGRIFAVPTYLFVGSCAVMLLVGLGRLASGHLDPVPAAATAPLPPAAASVGVLLVLHAFAAGCTALTGVEAISNGVPAFRPPEARNARRTLAAMGMILGSLFVGVSFLAVRVGVRPYASGNPTLIGQLARWVLGASPAGRMSFYLFQAATLAILVLAANTSFADFPRLVSFAAADAFLPRWFAKRGRRLVHSNGVLALSAAAAAVTLAYRAVLHALRYASQLNPLSVTALHVAADPGAADRLTRRWAALPLAVPLEVVHCPNRDLVDCATDAVGERVRPDTEVTVLLPRHGDQRRFRRLLHDQTGRELFAALSRLAGVNIAVVHPPAAAAPHRAAADHMGP
jgi:amino acid transporter